MQSRQRMPLWPQALIGAEAGSTTRDGGQGVYITYYSVKLFFKYSLGKDMRYKLVKGVVSLLGNYINLSYRYKGKLALS